METTMNSIETLIESVESYGKTSIELAKLKAMDSGSRIVAAVAYRLSVFGLVFLFVCFLSVGVALFLGERLGRPCYGFFVVAAVFLVVGIVFHHFLYGWIKKPIADLFFHNNE